MSKVDEFVCVCVCVYRERERERQKGKKYFRTEVSPCTLIEGTVTLIHADTAVNIEVNQIKLMQL